MNILRCLKNANDWFLCKTALHLKKVYCKVSLCEYCQRQSCKTFTDLSIRAKMVRVRRSVVRTSLSLNRDFDDILKFYNSLVYFVHYLIINYYIG